MKVEYIRRPIHLKVHCQVIQTFCLCSNNYHNTILCSSRWCLILFLYGFPSVIAPAFFTPAFSTPAFSAPPYRGGSPTTVQAWRPATLPSVGAIP